MIVGIAGSIESIESLKHFDTRDTQELSTKVSRAWYLWYRMREGAKLMMDFSKKEELRLTRHSRLVTNVTAKWMDNRRRSPYDYDITVVIDGTSWFDIVGTVRNLGGEETEEYWTYEV